MYGMEHVLVRSVQAEAGGRRSNKVLKKCTTLCSKPSSALAAGRVLSFASASFFLLDLPQKMFACSVQCRHLKAAAFFYPYYCSTASYPGMHPWTFDSFSISKKKKSLRLLQNMCVLGTKIKFTFQLITTQKDFISPTY
jgi:hypothetical protein